MNEMSNALVSLIIPVYNVQEYLRKCLDSAVGQSLKNLEIIIVDDGSTDSCPEIIAEYAAKDSRIRVISQRNMGLSAARNNGMAIATAEYISFMDSDDWADRCYIEKLYNEARRCDADIVVCRHANVFSSPDESVKAKNKSSIKEKTKSDKDTCNPESDIFDKTKTGNSDKNIYSGKDKTPLKIDNHLRRSSRTTERKYERAASRSLRLSRRMLRDISDEFADPGIGIFEDRAIKDLFPEPADTGRKQKSSVRKNQFSSAASPSNASPSNKKHGSALVINDDYALRKVISDSGLRSYAWGKIYKKSLFDDNNISYPDGLYFEDMATTFKLFLHAGRISIIRDCLYYYLQRKSSISKKLVPKKVYDNITAVSIMRNYLIDKGVFMDYYPEFRWLCQKIFLFSAFNLFLMYVRSDKAHMMKSIGRTAREIRSLMSPGSLYSRRQ